MKELATSLYEKLLSASTQPAPRVEGLLERPSFLLSPFSIIGTIHCGYLAGISKGLVALVDDIHAGSMAHDAPCWTQSQFLAQARQYPDALAIDFSFDPATRSHYAQLCKDAGVQYVDCALAQGQLGRFAVYSPADLYRSQTLDRLDDFLKVADRLADDYSRATLYANLLFRVTYDRDCLLAISADSQDEYFSSRNVEETFLLGGKEHYVDCGAYQGHIVEKFLESTGNRYASITAFEPDPVNYAKLSELASASENFLLLNKALSNEHGEIRFRADGTMGSHASMTGNLVVPTTLLDDEINQATFLKLDVEGFEPRTLAGGRRLLQSCRPRVAAAVYHYPLDLLDVIAQIDQHAGDDYYYRVRQHCANFYYDLVLYASPIPGAAPVLSAR